MSTEGTGATSFTSITTYLSWDHERLDRALAVTSEDVEAGRMAEARGAFAEYDRGLGRHMRIEEELLFPLFEARSGMAGGPTSVMRDEHRTIRVALDLMRAGLERDDPEAFRSGVKFLQSVLPAHNSKEEHILYPTTDRLLTERERVKFTARLLERA